MKITCLCLALIISHCSALLGQDRPEIIDWQFTSIEKIGRHKAIVIGSPKVVTTPAGNAAEFDGQSAIFLDTNPLAGLKEFTAEVVFQPAASGGKEQRFVHMQEDGSENRLLFELRLTDDNRWFLDTFIKSGEGNYTLFASSHPHPLGPWYHAAVVMDGKTLRHYVNGSEELSTPIKFAPQKNGKTSIGVRQNKVSWYSGAIRRLRITPRSLAVNEFLTP
jgi:hypothetical protein